MNELIEMKEKVTALLQSYAKNEYVAKEIAPMVAEKSLLMNHLYEDMEFKNRFIMGRFMKENFPEFAAKKPKDILWKKFIYDSVDLVAPACYECNDQVNCFACMLEDHCA